MPSGIGRVDDDGVDAGVDQVADVLELAGGVGVAVGDVERVDLARGERLGLDRADHLLAPAVALHGVGDADLVAGGEGRGALATAIAAPASSGSRYLDLSCDGLSLLVGWFGRRDSRVGIGDVT